LLAIVVLAGLLRLRGLDFGLPAINDPDELVFSLGAVKLLREGTLNPGWFGHPATTTIYVLALVDISVFAFGHFVGWFPTVKSFGDAIYADPSWAILPGRVVMMLFGIACVALTGRLAVRLYGPLAGICAAALLAFNPLHIAYSQVIRSDIMASTFMLLMLLAALAYSREGRRRDLFKASLWLGLAVASKWPFAATGIAFAGAMLLRLMDGRETLTGAVSRVVLFGLLSLAALIAASPYLLLDYQTALASVQSEAQVHHLGATGGSPLWNTWWYVKEPLRNSFGIAGLLLTTAGIGLGFRHRESRFLLLPPVLAFVLITVTQALIWHRWALPVVPLLAVFGGAALAQLLRFLMSWTGPKWGALAGLASIAFLFVPLALTASSEAAERVNNSAQVATGIADRLIPPGSRIMIEHFGFDLLSRPWDYQFPLYAAGCVDARAFIRGRVQHSTIEAFRKGRHNVDYGTLPPHMRKTCNADYAILSQYDRYVAEADYFPEEVAAYRELLSRSTLLATVRPEKGRMAGRVMRIIRIDHPPPDLGPFRR
jgi:hypothetical protein